MAKPLLRRGRAVQPDRSSRQGPIAPQPIMPLDTPQSHCQTPSTGEPDAGKPPVRFGGRGDINTVVPTPILHPAPTGREFLLPNHKPVLKFLPNHLRLSTYLCNRG